MEIRQTSEKDQEQIAIFGNKLLGHHQKFDSFYKPVDEKDAQKKTEPEKISFIASEGDTPVGFISGIFYKQPADRSVPFAILQSVWVEEDRRGQGIAAKLVKRFEDVVKDMGALQIDLFVDIQNTDGLKLWDQEGYVIYQERRRKIL